MFQFIMERYIPMYAERFLQVLEFCDVSKNNVSPLTHLYVTDRNSSYPHGSLKNCLLTSNVHVGLPAHNRFIVKWASISQLRWKKEKQQNNSTSLEKWAAKKQVFLFYFFFFFDSTLSHLGESRNCGLKEVPQLPKPTPYFSNFEIMFACHELFLWSGQSGKKTIRINILDDDKEQETKASNLNDVKRDFSGHMRMGAKIYKFVFTYLVMSTTGCCYLGVVPAISGSVKHNHLVPLALDVQNLVVASILTYFIHSICFSWKDKEGRNWDNELHVHSFAFWPSLDFCRPSPCCPEDIVLLRGVWTRLLFDHGLEFA